jgi:hypothetical protein
VIVRERNGNSIPAIFYSGVAAPAWVKSRLSNGMPMKPQAGMIAYLSTSCAALIMSKPVPAARLAQMKLKAISAAYAALRWAMTIL